ncbi:MAG: hypothetical protein ABI874_04125 [Chloroflexota bacterium]
MWLKGSLHTHTNNSDGDAPTEHVVDWYATHGYDFLAITDHNTITLPTSDRLLWLRSTEISLAAERKPIHVNAFDIGELQLRTNPDESIVQTLQRAVDVTNAAGGFAMINHPNFKWAFDHEAMARVNGWSLLEIYNASTDCNNFGFGGRIGVEAMWDKLLSAGQRAHGVATDDSHDFLKERWGHISPPGLAWVEAWVDQKSVAAVARALQAGDFYASTEIEFDELVMGESAFHLRIRQMQDYAYTTLFIGKDGHVFSAVHGTQPSYAARGDEGYVRAKVLSSNGGWAWTQPLWLDGE